jgi:hypothetical protein
MGSVLADRAAEQLLISDGVHQPTLGTGYECACQMWWSACIHHLHGIGERRLAVYCVGPHSYQQTMVEGSGRSGPGK